MRSLIVQFLLTSYGVLAVILLVAVAAVAGLGNVLAARFGRGV